MSSLKEKIDVCDEYLKKHVKGVILTFIVFIVINVELIVLHYHSLLVENRRMDALTLIQKAVKETYSINMFRIFPLPQRSLRSVMVTLFFIALCGIVMYLNDKLKSHPNQDTVQGDAKWMNTLSEYNKRFTEPFGSKECDGENNIILSQQMYLSMNNEKTNRNLNVLVIGGSGAGKSFNLVGPNIMQANASFIITDPSGDLYSKYGTYLERKGYKIKCLNLERMEKSSHYNPFHYIRDDADIPVLVTTIMDNTQDQNNKGGGDPFWEKAMQLLLNALVAYLYHYVEEGCQNFAHIMKLLKEAHINDAESTTERTPLDKLFDDVAENDPNGFALTQYRNFKVGNPKTLQSILITATARLGIFDLQAVQNITNDDDIDLESIGDEKTALFVIVPTGQTTYNCIAAMMYSQFFQRAYDYTSNTSQYTWMVMDAKDQLVTSFRAATKEEAKKIYPKVEAYHERAKNASIYFNNSSGLYEIRTKEKELVAFRGEQEDAEAALEDIRNGRIISNSEQTNDGHRMPIHVRLILDEFANTGKINNFPEYVSTVRKKELSVMIILQTLQQAQNMYEKEWVTLSGNCDNTVYLGGGADQISTEWLSKLLGKETRTVINTTLSRKSGSTSYQKQGVELMSPAQMRTLNDKECIVIPRGMPAFKGLKYRTLDHPQWEMIKHLDPYYYSNWKQNYFIAEKERIKSKIESPHTMQKNHGNMQPVEEKKEKETRSENHQKEQERKEAKENKDAEGNNVIGKIQNISGNEVPDVMKTKLKRKTRSLNGMNSPFNRRMINPGIPDVTSVSAYETA